MTDQQPQPHPSAVADASRWAKQEMERRVAEQGGVALPEVRAAVVAYVGADPDRLERFLGEVLGPMCYELASRVCARTRGHVVFGEEVMTREAMKQEVKRRRPRWQAWLEHTGERHVRLWEMRGPDLLAAAAQREARGIVEFRYGALWRELARPLRAGQTVGEVWSEEQVSDLAASLDVRIAVEVDRIESAALAAD